MPTYTQDNRLIAIDTPLGKDVLLLSGFHGMEGLSTPFRLELDLLSENHSIPFKDIIGKNVSVSVVLATGEKRYFHGLISRFSQGRGSSDEGRDLKLARYTATMVPWFWLLTRTADSRIFQNLSIPEIVEKIFKEKGFLDYKNKLHGSYDKWDYCVQYRETYFNFICRLLEEEGIYYFFEHENKKHTLVLTDTPEEHKPCLKQETARYQLSAGGWLEEDTLSSLEVMQEIKPGKYTLKDFNFETPNTDLKVESPSQKAMGPGEREIYDYPGGYGKRARGDKLANIRMQEEEAGITTITGSSDCRAFTSGYKFDLKDYYRKDMNNKAYVLTSLSHSARQGYATEDAASEFSYVNNFTCISFDVPYRPPRRTPKPVVEGVQTAIVVGPSGEEIYTDEHGRVKVQFHWDREGKNNDKSSCWIRVSQVWAGGGWGAMHIPHVGHEVIVNFIEGDPDMPIITGRVYHGNNKPTYELPGEKTKNVLRDRSNNELVMNSKEGGEKIELRDKYGNEIVLDAVAGTIRIYSPSHESEIVLGKSITLYTASLYKEEIKGNKLSTVNGNKEEHIVGNVKVKFGADITELYVGAESKQTLGWRNRMIGGWKQEIIIGAETKTVRGLKKEVVRGIVFKQHIGMEYEKAENGGRFKAPNLLQMIKDRKDMIKSERIKVEADAVREVGNEYLTKAKKLTEKFQDKLETGDNVILTASELFKVKASSKLKMEASKWLTLADEISMKGDTKIKGIVKLG